jgi:hypothetical protein
MRCVGLLPQSTPLFNRLVHWLLVELCDPERG